MAGRLRNIPERKILLQVNGIKLQSI